MSEFTAVLERYLEGRKVRGVAASMGIDRTIISQFTTGVKGTARPDTVMKMVAGISSDDAIQADLLRAYLRDTCTGRYKDWVRVEPPGDTDEADESSGVVAESIGLYSAGNPVSELSATLVRLKTPPALVRALLAIVKAIPGRHKFRVVIQDLGNFAQELLAQESGASTGK